MRHGPTPLNAHIGMALSACCGMDAQGDEELCAQMMLGIQKYQNYKFEIKSPVLKELWRSGEVSLEVLADEPPENKKMVLLLPSLVNGSQIFNLSEERSMMRYFVQEGLYPVLLDWGKPCADVALHQMGDLLQGRMREVLSFICSENKAPVDVLGYCMGGTILAASAALYPQYLRSLVFLAAPWDFHGGAQHLYKRVQFWAPSAFSLLAEKNYLPENWLQTLFASIDPQKTAQKFAKFSQMEPGSSEEKLFVAVEDWLNEGVDLPAPLAQHCIRKWFFENEPGQGNWNVADKCIQLSQIQCPVLIVASGQDRLVEYEIALPLAHEIKQAHTLNPACGHISMMAGRHAVKNVWQPITNFWELDR